MGKSSRNEYRNICTSSYASIHNPSTLEGFVASIEELGLTIAIFESRSHFMEGSFCKFGVHGKFERRKFCIVVVTKRIFVKPLSAPLHVFQLAITQINTLQSLKKKPTQTYLCCKFLQENLVVDSTSTWLHSIVLSNHPSILQTIRKISRRGLHKVNQRQIDGPVWQEGHQGRTQPSGKNGQTLWMPFIQG